MRLDSEAVAGDAAAVETEATGGVDPDWIDDLEDEIATLAGHLHAGSHRLIALLARFDRVRGWERAGHRTCAHWLAYRAKLDLGTAREHVRVARALAELPRTSAAMARGALSFSQVRALTRAAKPDTEADLLELAEAATASQLERVVRAWKKGSGTPGEAGAAGSGSEPGEATEGDDPDERRGAGEPCPACGRPPVDPPISGTRAERYQVFLHVDLDTLAEDGEPGRSELEDGTRVSAETSRRPCCDAAVVRVTRGADGSVVDVGRKTRTIPGALRRALEVRDRRCRFPGCALRFTDGHHLVHWADGGATSLANTLLLCGHHHRLVHEGGWTVEWWGPDPGGARSPPAFRDPRGHVHVAGRRPPRSRLPRDPTAALVRRNRLRGVEPDAWTAGARWKREADIPDDVFFRALEAAL